MAIWQWGWPARAGMGLLLASAAAVVHAQGFPGGGMGGGMGMGGDGPRGGSGGVKAPEHVPTLEELMPADPWRIWLEKLAQARTGLGLGDEALLAFDTFTHELRDAQEYNTRRVERAVRHRPSRISAVVDVGRDLREEAADAAEWQAALTDLLTRWQALRAALSPAQQGAVDALYTEAMTQARAMPAGAGRGPQPKD